ncbi:hypothetical protein CBOM_07711 [Ceraceosorus bombacis]|uniref:Uncharacterized protein n=1 Tax=Ceraceosorus bombacis TaxID=401625 RepID=A0A0P1BGG1_9BASI|nr:hypothetical protein CBOM_07711 [Ceraceosorus bombacis]
MHPSCACKAFLFLLRQPIRFKAHDSRLTARSSRLAGHVTLLLILSSHTASASVTHDFCHSHSAFGASLTIDGFMSSTTPPKADD